MASLSGYGQDFEATIGKVTAQKLAGMYPLPRIGYEITVAIAPDPVWSGFKFRMHLQNICGQLVLASTNVKRSDWPEIFKVTI